MPAPYALQVSSQPIHVSEELWTQWYTEEHIRELVYSGCTRTSVVYRAAGPTMSANALGSTSQDLDTTFLAIYQSDAKHVLEACQSPNLKCKVRVASSLFPESKTCYDLGTFKPLDLQLVEVLGSYETREDVAPCVLHHVIAGDEIENKVQFDHINAVAQLGGYRRTLLYRPIEPMKYGAPDIGPYVILLHEFDSEIEDGSLDRVKTAMEKIGPTVGYYFSIRPFQMIESEGFEGRCRTPERVELL